MNIQFAIADTIAEGRSNDEISSQARSVFLLHEYLQDRLTMGELAEQLGWSFYDTREWVAAQGYPLTRKLNDPELEAKLDKDREEVFAELGISLPAQK